ncbi:glycoside hydrolase family 27 protein [Viridothelium virens]|uniref:Alpha-galactosidase n=1 Tax=Viridothelium virens TaxID=1048519 RepID=A0A6A6H0N7_VIRVR|nr:glycoside hydrolase family 27 protein [Viridothelium virens]
MMALKSVFLSSLLPCAFALVRPNDVGRLPALGWNSWNAYHCDVSEDKILQAANFVVSLGLKDVGYEYINVDDCWSVKSGRNTTTQQIIPNATTFPDGISGTAEQVHALGLKIGIYSSAGTETCAGYPASIGYENVDAATFAAWGIDYLKYDNCNVPSNWTDTCVSCVSDYYTPALNQNGSCAGEPSLCPSGYNYSTSNTASRYRLMRDALLAQNRTILYSLCDWGQAYVESWGNATGNSWRMSDDISPPFERILAILNENSFQLNATDFWGHNDADMLEVGNGISAAQTRSHFALWAAMKSPLIIGTDLSGVSDADVAVLKNAYLLAFNQDAEVGAPATPYKWGVNPDYTFNASFPAEYWSGESSNGTLVLVGNWLNETMSKVANYSEIPGLQAGGAYQVVDVWAGSSLGCVQNGVQVNVEANDTAVYLIQEGCGSVIQKRRT